MNTQLLTIYILHLPWQAVVACDTIEERDRLRTLAKALKREDVVFHQKDEQKCLNISTGSKSYLQ